MNECMVRDVDIAKVEGIIFVNVEKPFNGPRHFQHQLNYLGLT